MKKNFVEAEIEILSISAMDDIMLGSLNTGVPDSWDGDDSLNRDETGWF